MKTFAIATALALAVPALAQTVADLPQCAQQPILLAISSSGCGLTDFGCICANQNFVNGLLKTIPTLCTPAETQIVSGFAIRFCGAAGVTLSLPSEALSATTLSAPPTLISSPAVTPAITTSSFSNSTVTRSSNGTITTTGTLTTTTSGTRTSSSSSRATTTSVAPNDASLKGVGYAGLIGALALGVVGL